MIIIALTDIHGKVDYLPQVANDLRGADLILIAGDITNFGNKADAQMILSQLRQYNTNILAVPGNCDPAEVNDLLGAEGINLNGNCIEKDGIGFAGLGGSLPCHGLTPYEMSEQSFGDRLTALESKITTEKFVLVTHQPARGTRADHVGEKHCGCDAIREFVERTKPVIAVSGHVHEAIGVDKIGETTVLNPGPFRDGSYAYILLDDDVLRVAIRSAHDDPMSIY